MIESRAIENQRASKDVKILAAYYGSKSAIKQFVDHKLTNGEDLLDDGSVPVLPFQNVPRYVLNVTVSCRFLLTPKGLFIQTQTTKANLIGFFKPFPDFVTETNCLCIAYKIKDQTTVQYFSDDATLI